MFDGFGFSVVYCKLKPDDTIFDNYKQCSDNFDRHHKYLPISSSTDCTFYFNCKQFWPFTIYVVINDKATEVEEEAVEHSIDKEENQVQSQPCLV